MIKLKKFNKNINNLSKYRSQISRKLIKTKKHKIKFFIIINKMVKREIIWKLTIINYKSNFLLKIQPSI